MRIIVLTGSIACGKSTIANALRESGWIIIDSDKIAREVVEPGKPGLASIVNYFGEKVLRKDGSLDRKKLGDIIFKLPSEREVLNAIVHPLVNREIRKRLLVCWMSGYERVALDIPLFYDSHMERRRFFRGIPVLLVSCPPELQLRRLMARNSLTESQARDRIGSQMPQQNKAKMADAVFVNDCAIEEIPERLGEVMATLPSMRPHSVTQWLFSGDALTRTCQFVLITAAFCFVLWCIGMIILKTTDQGK